LRTAIGPISPASLPGPAVSWEEANYEALGRRFYEVLVSAGLRR